MALTYNGTTAGSTLANPPVVMAAAIGGRLNWVTSGSTVDVGTYGAGAKIWFYSSSNAASELAALNSFGDGVALGMTRGDVLIGVTSTAGSTAPICFMGVLVTSGGATGFGLSSNYITSTAV